MKITNLLTTAALLGGCAAVPTSFIKRQLDPNDLTVLQFALTLEHLENVYYKQALAKFTQQDFINAGFTETDFSNVQFVAFDEEAHVKFLTKAIQDAGAAPVAACQYNFGNALNDVRSMVGLSSVLEGIGVAAYLGGARILQSKDLLGVAGSVLVAEGLHQGAQRTALREAPSANIAGTELGPNAVFTLAAGFLASCPQTNAALPFQAFQQLDAVTPQPVAAASTQVFTANQAVPEPFFVTFVSGLDTVSVQGSQSNGQITAAVPQQAQGQTYAFITNTQVTGRIQDSQVLFGPAILEVTPPAPVIDPNLLK